MRHVISIFLDLLQVRYNWTKFHHCRIGLTDFRKEKTFYPPPPPDPWAAPKMYSKGLTATPSFTSLALSEKCANTEIFLVCIFLYSNWILENADQKKLRIWALFTQCSLGQLQFHKPRTSCCKCTLHNVWKMHLQLRGRYKPIYLREHNKKASV